MHIMVIIVIIICEKNVTVTVKNHQSRDGLSLSRLVRVDLNELEVVVEHPNCWH